MPTFDAPASRHDPLENAGAKLAIPFRTLLAVAAAFWLFVTLTDIFYGYSMKLHVASVAPNSGLFADWDARLLQHLLLFPFLVGCFALSLQLGWTPWTRVPLQAVLGVVFAALPYSAMQAAQTLVWRGTVSDLLENFRDLRGALWTSSFVMFFMTYSFGIILITGFAFYRRFRDAEARNSALERNWSDARLAALRMQLSPHTLFNLLHTIRGHIKQEPEIARSMVMQLANLLRRLLSAGQREFSPLTEELAFVRLYLELQQRRFAERLSFTLPSERELSDVWIPSLILQPLVENAVVHGLAGHEAQVIVSVVAQLDPEFLTLRVINTMAPGTGAGMPGIGLSNVRERLEVQFRADASFLAGPSAAEEWVAEIRLPVLREFPVSPPLKNPQVV